MKIVNKKRFICVITILILVISTILCGVKANTKNEYETELYVVTKGDTMWRNSQEVL